MTEVNVLDRLISILDFPGECPGCHSEELFLEKFQLESEYMRCQIMCEGCNAYNVVTFEDWSIMALFDSVTVEGQESQTYYTADYTFEIDSVKELLEDE